MTAITVREHRSIPAIDGVRGGDHTLRQESFQNRTIVVGHQLAFVFHGGGRIPAEQVGSRRIMRSPNTLLPFLRKIAREVTPSRWRRFHATAGEIAWKGAEFHEENVFRSAQ
jgi:hypothetical protein